jgi:hypothetical protein
LNAAQNSAALNRLNAARNIAALHRLHAAVARARLVILPWR